MPLILAYLNTKLMQGHKGPKLVPDGSVTLKLNLRAYGEAETS
jgi:hypothetical protein